VHLRAAVSNGYARGKLSQAEDFAAWSEGLVRLGWIVRRSALGMVVDPTRLLLAEGLLFVGEAS
jgi:hypothetical protein